MPDMTAQEVVVAAYRKRGTTNPPSAILLAAGLQDLQNMMASWSVEGLIVPYYTTENFTLTTGKAVYTIGDSGSPDFNTPRPSKIVNAWIRESNNDYPVGIITEKEYNRVVKKDSTSRPKELYYDPQYPLGKIYFDYEANLAYDFHLVSEKPFTELSALATAISLPREINEVLIYNLAIRLAPDKNIELKSQVYAIAASSLDTLRGMNAYNKLKKPMDIDSALVTPIIR